jgi:hypothetical protein
VFGPLFVQVLGLYEHRRAALGGQSGAVSGGRWWRVAFGTVEATARPHDVFITPEPRGSRHSDYTITTPSVTKPETSNLRR